MPLKYGIGKRIANAATTETRWDGLWMEARKEKLETPIQLCSFNTLWGCDVARAFTSNTFAVVFSWGKTWDFFFFFFLLTESRVESSNVDSWNPFLKNAIRISNFCVSANCCLFFWNIFLSLSRDTLSREEKNVLRNRIFFKENKNSSNQSWISEDVMWAMEEEIKENWQDIIRTLRESRFQFLSYFCFFFFIVIDRFN